mmetsp:Transcript_48308/g.94781  ORF Transcript_48308/g.94781 Transcript_48308/m.94781 type:complete len:186 (+) Transcript_48308:1-558(+)
MNYPDHAVMDGFLCDIMGNPLSSGDVEPEVDPETGQPVVFIKLLISNLQRSEYNVGNRLIQGLEEKASPPMQAQFPNIKNVRVKLYDPLQEPIISRYAGQSPDRREYDLIKTEDSLLTDLKAFQQAKQLIIDADNKHSDTVDYVQTECGRPVCGDNAVEAIAVGTLGQTGINTRKSVLNLGSTGY